MEIQWIFFLFIYLFIFFSIIRSLAHRLFEDHGELLGLFNKFRELKTKEQQASSEELGEHANKVMETLDEGIRSLDELDTFFEYLHQVGASHTRIPDFKSEYFWVSLLIILLIRSCYLLLLLFIHVHIMSFFLLSEFKNSS